MTEDQDLAVVDPRTDYMVHPLGLSQPPRFSWRLESGRPGVCQAAWRIEAASDAAVFAVGAADVWDSGRVEQTACFDVVYGGRPLVSGERVFWRVTVWDAHGAAATSEIAWFEMGLLQPQDWRGDWLVVQDAEEEANRAAGLHWIWCEGDNDGVPVKFRFTFSLAQAPRASFLLLSAKDNLHGVWLNGRPVPMPPTVTWGTMISLPLSLAAGNAVLAIEVSALTDGFLPADGGALAALIRIENPDGTVTRLTSAKHWRATKSSAAAWFAPTFDDRAWPAAVAARAHADCEPWPAGPAMRLRRTFAVPKPVARARLYATALGLYEIELNGKRVGDGLLTPEISTAEDHLFYQSYDVTALLRAGKNAIGATIGDGWIAGAFAWRSERYALHAGPKRFFAQLEITYADGLREAIATDRDWRLGPSPILTSEIYNGETFDARREQPGWSLAEFDDSAWVPAVVGTPPHAARVGQPGPLLQRIAVLQPVRRSDLRPHTAVFDFGQNFSGWARLKVAGKSGETVTLRYGELLRADGSVDQSNLRLAAATDRYIVRGDAAGEAFEPHFTYHGFRYVEVESAAEIALEGVVVHSAVAESGDIRFVHPLLQRLCSNARWSQRSNFFGVPTDCPQRDERMGWTGDIQVFLDAAAFNMDVDAFIRRFLHEMRAGQTPDGAYPVVTPQPRSFAPMWTAGWSEAGIILPWTLYRRYGDTAVIAENWSAMVRWMDFLRGRNPDCLWRTARGIDLGDWLTVDAIQPADETTPRILVATAYWAYAAQLMAEMATAIGRPVEAAVYTDLRAQIGRVFAQAFVAADGRVGNGSQTGYVLALHFGLVPTGLRAAAAAKLVAEIAGRGNRLSTGFLGTPYLIDVLLDTGHLDMAVKLLLQTQYPSWGYMVEKGATTMWERWNSDVGDLAMNSYNHYAFGAIVGTLYRRFAGIAPAKPGFAEILVHPVFDARIGRVEADYQSAYGRIATVVDGDDIGLNRLSVIVPPGATAKILLPKLRPWREGGRILADRPDMRLEVNGVLAVYVGSGAYEFRVV